MRSKAVNGRRQHATALTNAEHVRRDLIRVRPAAPACPLQSASREHHVDLGFTPFRQSPPPYPFVSATDFVRTASGPRSGSPEICRRQIDHAYPAVPRRPSCRNFARAHHGNQEPLHCFKCCRTVGWTRIGGSRGTMSSGPTMQQRRKSADWARLLYPLPLLLQGA